MRSPVSLSSGMLQNSSKLATIIYLCTFFSLKTTKMRFLNFMVRSPELHSLWIISQVTILCFHLAPSFKIKGAGIQRFIPSFLHSKYPSCSKSKFLYAVDLMAFTKSGISQMKKKSWNLPINFWWYLTNLEFFKWKNN